MPMATICSSCSALVKVDTVTMRVRVPVASRVTAPWEGAIVGSGSPSSPAKPSSNSRRRGASIAVICHQPRAFWPSGPVM